MNFELNRLYNFDCMAAMKQIPDKYFQLAIIDPPYGIGESGKDNQRRGNLAKAKKYKPYYGNDKNAPSKEYFSELFRVSDNQVIFGANHFIDRIPFSSPCWIVWDKENGTNDFADCELAWTSFKTAARIFRFKWQGMLQGDMKHKEIRIHPNQKPVKLYEWLLVHYAKPGDRILDTHVGSASSLIACYNLGFDFIGFEIDRFYFEQASQRLKEAQAQLKLSDFMKLQGGEVSRIKNLTLGSLFDGIGGFPLAAQRCGIKTLWASEIERNCISITKRHFSQMVHLGDITNINGGKILPVDIVTFGSPCQDLSSAGRQEGLAGKRSGLFREAIRIIYEMRCATNGKYPTFIIWENVSGAFTSNKGQDFRTVLEEITKSRISMPASGKWAKAGMVRTGRVEVAWRQLDAQYWGVPQRRKRIFLVADFGRQRASEILFKCESLLGYSEKGREDEKKNAAIIGNGTESTSSESVVDFDRTADRIYINANISRTIIASAGGLGAATGLYLIKQVYPIRDPTLNKGANGFVVGDVGAPAPTLSSIERHAVAYFEAYQRNGYRQSDIAGTITAGQNARIRGDTPVILKPENLSATGDNNKTISLLTYYVLRRLTPLECERLQGYPDDWTKYADTGEEIKDTPRYVALGNSLAIPCVERIFRGIVNVLNESCGDDE